MNLNCLKLFFIIFHVVFGYKNHINDKLKPSNEARIENGIVVNGSEVPSIVQLLREPLDDGPFCAGTLIASNVVLTAAHCIYDLDDYE